MRVFSSLRCSRKETLRVHLCIVGGYHPFDENYPFVINGRQTVKITQQQQQQHQRHDTFSSSAKMTTNGFEKNTKKASAFSSAVSPSSKRRRRGRNDKMLGFSSFLCVALCCVFLASWAPTSAHAAAKAITWAYSAQTVTMLTTDTLTISWSGNHDVYYSTTGTCSGGTSKAEAASSGSYKTTSGEMAVGTHYFYCSINDGAHCEQGMYVTVNVTKGNSAILNPSDVTYTATDINGATKAADWNTDCSWGGTGSCGAGYCTDMSTKPKCDANQLKSPNVAATSIDSAEELAKYTAQTCTQADSTVDERCGATWLNTWMSAGRLGTGGAVAAYCNDKYLVIIGTGATGFTTNMADISQAPGGTYYPDGTTATDCVTSEVTVSSPKMETTAIPLKTGEYRYTLLDTALGSNNFDTFSGGAGDGNTKYLCDTDAEGCFGLPSWTGVGVSTTGQSIYPLYSNVVRITLDACEVDSCNEHVGQGGGQPHLHGDPFHASDTMCHYGPANYTDGTDGHPPVIGFAYDGPTIYGRYLSTSAPGFSDGLDDCGGHEHSADSTAYGGYHYHAQVISATTSSGNKGVNKNANTGKTYPAFTPGPYKCFRGDLSKRGDADYSYWSTNVPVQDTKPCNGMTHYWVKPGLSIPGAGTLAVTLATCDASAAPTNGAVGTCTSTLASGSTCQPTCNTGYTVSGTSSCYDGTLTAATCSASPCDASAAPANGAVGTCTSTLASGSTCQPTCNTGYTVSGTSSCLAGTFTTAECSVAPSPPPPSPPPPAAAAVQAEMQLTGYSAAEFDDDKKTNFKTGMAKYLGVDSAAITITSVVDVTAGRRKLSAVDSVLKVEFTVEATTFSDTTALETKLVVTDVTTMENELISAGLAVSNIVAPTTITALAPPPSPPPSPPPPASTSPLLSVVKLIAATAALAFFAC